MNESSIISFRFERTQEILCTQHRNKQKCRTRFFSGGSGGHYPQTHHCAAYHLFFSLLKHLYTFNHVSTSLQCAVFTSQQLNQYFLTPLLIISKGQREIIFTVLYPAADLNSQKDALVVNTRTDRHCFPNPPL